MRSSTRARSGVFHVDPTAGASPFGKNSAADAGSFDRRSFESLISSANAASTAKPSRAIAMAGARRSFHGLLPFAACSAQRPATLAGVPLDAFHPHARGRGRRPARRMGPTYMSRDAAAGAVSRKSSARSSAPKRTTANPPPPRLPAVGYATAIANAVATAASTALPPCWSTSSPIFVASAQSLVTAPCGLGAPIARALGTSMTMPGTEGVA